MSEYKDVELLCKKCGGDNIIKEILFSVEANYCMQVSMEDGTWMHNSFCMDCDKDVDVEEIER